jgi:3-oxoacyl-[acyl-carrier-protein] synthase-1
MTLPAAYFHGFEVLSAAGQGLDALEAAWQSGASPGLVQAPGWGVDGADLPVGRVLEPLLELPDCPPEHRSRNNQLAWTALQGLRPLVEAAVGRYGALRVGVVIGTSTSGVAEAEAAFAERQSAGGGALPGWFRYETQEIGSPARFAAWALGLRGPALVVSTACSSSGKALASARRLLRSGACDAVLCGGVDSLCRFTVRGFGALGAVSDERCRPFSSARKGINIGEAAAFTLLSREASDVRLAGCGESSDGYNVSAPLPQGEGAEAAMRAALRDAGCTAQDVGYLNLHGTATAQNDAMEALAALRVFPGGVPCSSTKPLTGHTLGAAGALEAALCWHLLRGASRRGLPPNWNGGDTDAVAVGLGLVEPGRPGAALDRALSNSFGFGGSNVSVLLERA